MNGLTLINWISTLMNIYYDTIEWIDNNENLEENYEIYDKFPDIFKFLNIIQDKTYPQKYIIRLSFEDYLDELNDDDIVIIDYYIKESDELDYNNKLISYIKKVDNCEISKVYYNNFINNIPKKYDCFVLDFLSEVFGMGFKFTKTDIETFKQTIKK